MSPWVAPRSVRSAANGQEVELAGWGGEPRGWGSLAVRLLSAIFQLRWRVYEAGRPSGPVERATWRVEGGVRTCAGRGACARLLFLASCELPLLRSGAHAPRNGCLPLGDEFLAGACAVSQPGGPRALRLLWLQAPIALGSASACGQCGGPVRAARVRGDYGVHGAAPRGALRGSATLDASPAMHLFMQLFSSTAGTALCLFGAGARHGQQACHAALEASFR